MIAIIRALEESWSGAEGESVNKHAELATCSTSQGAGFVRGRRRPRIDIFIMSSYQATRRTGTVEIRSNICQPHGSGVAISRSG